MELPLALAFVIGLSQIVKKTRLIADRYFPFIVLIIGIAVSSLLEAGFDYLIVSNGIMFGLISMGMWSGSKTILTK